MLVKGEVFLMEGCVEGYEEHAPSCEMAVPNVTRAMAEGPPATERDSSLDAYKERRGYRTESLFLEV